MVSPAVTDDVEAHGEMVGNGGTLRYRLDRLERDRLDDKETLKELSDRMDRVVLAVVGFALTLAVFGLGIAVTLLTARK